MGNKNKVLNEAIKATQTLNKQYGYKKANVSLDFTLNVKNKEEMSNFVDLMKKAIEDVSEDINAI